MKSESDHRRDIVEVCKRIHARGWISSTDGNVSVKLRNDRILITPTGIHKGYMSERELIVCDMNGKVISGAAKPSSEITLHLTCYRERPNVQAVVHAHPTISVAFSLAGITLAKCLLPEVVFTLGSIPTADYAPPATAEVADSIRKYIKDFDAIILERHGSLTVGADLFAAYNTLERMEHVAQITFHARQLGAITPLSPEQISRLQQIGDKQGWPRKKISEEACNNCNACGKFGPNGCGPKQGQAPASAQPDMAAVIAEEIAEALGKAGR
ncbi:MAG: class II aldolase/adducin family protein [Nitrospinota bacterium]|nr:class II aldolase/adducin family protein [Nitrospinota bacterium]